MRKIISLLLISGVVFLNFSTTGCKKEVHIQTIDSMAVVKDMLIGKWLVKSYEWEIYSGSIMTNKVFEYVSDTATHTEYWQNMTYASFYKGVPNGSGPWKLVSPYYLVLNSGVEAEERYYYIIKLDKKILITHGPFRKDGTLYNGKDLYTFYYEK